MSITPRGVPASPSPDERDALDSLLASLPSADAARIRGMMERSERHEARLQLLQQIATSLARSLDEDEVIDELTRGVERAVDCDGVLVARVDLDRSLVDVVHHVVRGEERPPQVVPLGAGPLAEAARTGALVHVSPYDPATSPLAAADDVVGPEIEAAAVLVVPMMHGRRLLGVVAVHDTDDRCFDQDAREVLSTLATHAAGALANARLFADSERERRQSEAMAEIARAVGESLKMGEVMRLILRHAMALLQAEGAAIALRRDDYLHIVSALGVTELLSGVHLPVAGSLSGQVVTTGAAVVTNDIATDSGVHRPTLRLVPIQKAVVVPLMTAHGILGVIAVYNRGADFSADDARVLQRLADQVAVAVANARLFEEVQDATREWSAAFESIGVGMCVVDDDGRITRFNSRALQLSEQEAPRTLVGRIFYDALLGAIPDPGDDPLARAIRDGAQARTVCEGAGGRWLEITAVPHPNGGAIVTFDDVSAQRAVWDRNRLVVEASADPLCTIDREGRVIFSNPAARALFRRDDLLGTRWSDLVIHDMADEARTQVLQAMQGEPQHLEYVIVCGDGERRIITAALAPVHEGGVVAMVVASLHDVTGERRAREAVTQSEARYRNLFDAATDAIFTLNRNGAITSANPATCDVFDVPSDQLLGRSLYPFLAPPDVDRATMLLKDALHGERRHWECAIVRRNGVRRTLSLTASPLRHGRSIVGLLAVARDVTEEYERSDALRKSEARYAQLVETASDAIFTVDEEGNFNSVNRAFEAATGRGRDDIAGQHFTTVLDPRDRDATWEVFVATLHGQRGRHEVRYLDAAGRSRWGSLIASPITQDGRVIGALGVVRDVSADKALVEEMLRRERLSAVAPLVGDVAHEVNNPLAAVLALTELLIESPPITGREQQTLELIRDETRRASRVVRGLLDVARELPSARQGVQVAEVVERALALRRHALAQQGIALHADVPGDLPPTLGDRPRLQQVVLHLIGRAEHTLQRWTGERRITVRLSRVADALVLVVQDTGPGMTAAELERVFQPLVAIRSAPDLAALGVSVAEDIVRAHGGRMHADSTPGEGSTFIIELPIVAVEELVHTDAFAVHPPEEVIPAAEPLDVLVVDDEPSIRLALARALEALGHRVHLAGDGEEARDALEQRRFDRVLLDLRMPRLAGDALFADLAVRRPDLAEQVIFLTGAAENEGTEAFLRQTGRLTLRKPFSLDDVRRAIVGVDAVG